MKIWKGEKKIQQLAVFSGFLAARYSERRARYAACVQNHDVYAVHLVMAYVHAAWTQSLQNDTRHVRVMQSPPALACCWLGAIEAATREQHPDHKASRFWETVTFIHCTKPSEQEW